MPGGPEPAGDRPLLAAFGLARAAAVVLVAERQASKDTAAFFQTHLRRLPLEFRAAGLLPRPSLPIQSSLTTISLEIWEIEEFMRVALLPQPAAF